MAKAKTEDKRPRSDSPIEKSWSVADMLSYASAYAKRNDKIKVVRDYTGQNPWIKEVLYYAYSPFIQFFMAEKSMPKPSTSGGLNTQLVFNELSWRQIVKPLLDGMANRTMTSNEIQLQVASLFGRLSVADRSIVKRVILKDLRIGMAETTLNEAFGEDLIPIPDTQLCNTYEPGKNYEVASWWASRKMNGIRCRFKRYNNKWMLLTRKDHPIEGFPHLEGELLDLCTKNKLSMVDGELFSTTIPFQDIASIVRGNSKITREQKESIYLNVFCVLPEGGRWGGETAQMAEWLRKASNMDTWRVQCPHILAVEYRELPNNPVNIEQWCKEFTKEGYEGIVLRHPDTAWSSGRNDNLLKYKIFFETDLVIEEVKYGTPGKKWEGKVAALLCRGEVPAVERQVFGMTVYKPVAMEEAEVMIPVKVEASCSTLSDEERETVTELAADLPGLVAEVKFQTFTDKPDADGYYSLAFPTFQKFKGL